MVCPAVILTEVASRAESRGRVVAKTQSLLSHSAIHWFIRVNHLHRAELKDMMSTQCSTSKNLSEKDKDKCIQEGCLGHAEEKAV